jgi:serine/threonine protein kinase
MSVCINPECKKIHNSDTLIFCQQCGSELLLDGRYRVIKELGQGGFGTTYEILDLNSRPWVLKVLMAHIVCQRIIKQNPSMTESELCYSLAQTIPNPQQAKEFKQRLIH